MRWFLDLLYLLGFVLASPWLCYRSIKSGGWRDISARLGFIEPPACDVWVHGASVGEVKLIEPLIRGLEQRGLRIAVSSHTATGVRAAKIAYPEHAVFRLPFDFSFIQRRFISCLSPRLLIVAESDLWPNQLLAAESCGVSIAVVNGKLSERSFRLHRFSRLVPRALKGVALIAAQTPAHAQRFAGLGVPQDRIFVTGNMKYDLTSDVSAAADRSAIRERLGMGDDSCLIIGGSLHPKEDEDLIAAFEGARRSVPQTQLVIVPRYPDYAGAVQQHAASAGLRAVKKSELDANPDRGVSSGEVVVVDTLGDLRKFYAAADIAFVGGSLYFRGSNKGGHNLMEPAILGLPVIFGPHNFSFRETVADLLAADAGLLVKDRGELGTALLGLVESREERRLLGQRARQVILHGQGASQRNLELLAPLLDGGPGCSATAKPAQCRHQTDTRMVNE